MGEHLPYKQRVIGSSPIVPTKGFAGVGVACAYGLVAQLVRALPCHGRGRGFEPHPGRHYASVAQLVEQRTENPRVVGSIPTGGTSDFVADFCGFSSFGRARPCQGRGGGFEPRNPLHRRTRSLVSAIYLAPWPSGKARVCKTLIPGPIPGGASKTQNPPFGGFCVLQASADWPRSARKASRPGPQHSECRWHSEIPGGNLQQDNSKSYCPPFGGFCVLQASADWSRSARKASRPGPQHSECRWHSEIPGGASKCSGLKRCRSKNPRFSRVFFVFRRFPHFLKFGF